MREIITLQIGGGGNAIGQEVFTVLSAEHGINVFGKFIGTNPLQLERVNIFFKEGQKKYSARSIAVDTDQESIDKLGSGSVCKLYAPGNLIKGLGGTGNNFAKGYYDIGPQLMETITNAIRLEAESCDTLQGFQIIHTLGGGTGSALSALLWQHIRDDYKGTITESVSIIPSPKLSAVIVEPYNCLLCFPYLLDNTDLTFCIDNEALYDICVNRLNITSASNHDTNHLIAHAMSGVTTCLRFPGQLNTGLRKLYVNMVPFPNLHFLVPGFTPLISCDRLPYEKLTISEMVNQMFSRTNMFAAIDFHKNKTLTIAAIFRGLISPKEVDFALKAVKTRNATTLLNWLPSNVQIAFCDIPPMGLKMSSTFVANSTGMTQLFTRVDEQFSSMYNRKAYIHWYTENGMEESQFKDAQEKLHELVKLYQDNGKDFDGIPENDSNCCIGRKKDKNKSDEIKGTPPNKNGESNKALDKNDAASPNQNKRKSVNKFKKNESRKSGVGPTTNDEPSKNKGAKAKKK